MKRGRSYSEDEAVYFLKTKGCEITGTKGAKVIGISKAKGLGNGSWGRLDFLLKYHGYYLSRRQKPAN